MLTRLVALALLVLAPACVRPLASTAASPTRTVEPRDVATVGDAAAASDQPTAAERDPGVPESNGPFGRVRYEAPEACTDEERALDRCEPDDRYLSQALLERDARTILDAPPRPPRATPWASWDRRSLPPGVRGVADRLGLDARVLDALRRNGFAVLAREGGESPYEVLRDIYVRELPLYVTADAVLHAVFRSHERLVASLEAPLAERLAAALARAHAALPGASARWPREVGRDVDLHLTVARTLLSGAEVAPAFEETRAPAGRLVALATDAGEMSDLELFGRVRVVDFTAFAPRGPYADDEARRRWFRGATWLSRVELNVVSRDCRSSHPGSAPDPRETPREALDALALAELLDGDGVRETVDRAEGIWSALAGRGEDVTPAQLTRLRAAANIARLDEPGAFERLARAVGDGFPRTARTRPMPAGVVRLPVTASVLGARVVPDAAMTLPLVHDAVAGRSMLGAADVAFALGHEPAGRHLAADLAAFPGLREGFARARAIALAPMNGADLYGAWFEGVRSLARRPAGVMPSFAEGAAWGDLRMNSIVAGFGQLRHANVLVAASSYDGRSCAIPDAYVDPTPDLYDALLVYVARARAMMAREGDWLGADALLDLTRYFDEAERTYRVLRRVVADELAGHELTAAQRRFVGSVVEVLPSSMGYPQRTGWYLDLFPGDDAAMASASFVADWYASVNANRVAYLGVRGTALGLFVVDRGGPPRLMVGPVADAYEYTAPLARRADDASMAQVDPAERRAPWAASYTVAPFAAPAMTVETSLEDERVGRAVPRAVARRLLVRTAGATGTLSVEFLDRAGSVVARGTSAVGPRQTRLTVSWLPSVLRALAPSRGEEPSGLVCGRRLRLGRWVDVRFDHPRPNRACEATWLMDVDVDTLTHAPNP